jgi:hypothetical protein
MANTPDLASCPDLLQEQDSAQSPFFALSYHFGMLLGVDDFATEQAYHRGKMRLHNAWLHRDGVAWGLNVTVDKDHGEVHVLPGLAYDAAGHELHLEGDACVNVGDWFQAHKDDPGFVLLEDTPTHKKFDAHIEARFHACLTRQVPALLEPCAGAGGGGTSYSRLYETVDLRLAPGKAPARTPPPLPYHRLRVLFGIEDAALPADQPVLDARDQILLLATDAQPAAYVAAFHRLAALDEIELKPALNADQTQELIGPAADDAPLMLADIAGLTIDQKDGVWSVTAGDVDITIRLTHVAVSTIQDLLCGPLFRDVAAAAAAGAGPRVVAGSVDIPDDQTITFQVDQDLHPQSVKAGAFSVTIFDNIAGWLHLKLQGDPAFAAGPPKLVTVPLKDKIPAKARVRLVVRGAGPAPVLGANFEPLEGIAGGPAIQPGHGADFVWMAQRS